MEGNYALRIMVEICQIMEENKKVKGHLGEKRDGRRKDERKKREGKARKRRNI